MLQCSSAVSDIKPFSRGIRAQDMMFLGVSPPPGKKNLTPIGTSPNFFKPQGFPLAPTSVDPALKVKYVQK